LAKCFERTTKAECDLGTCIGTFTGNTISCSWNATTNRCGGFCRVSCNDISNNCVLLAIFTLATCPDGSFCQADPQNRNGPCLPCGTTPAPFSDKKRQASAGVCECASSTLPSDMVSDSANLVADTDATPIIAGAVAGGVVLLLLCALVLWCVLARRKRDDQRAPADDKEQMTARSERPVSQYGIVPVAPSPQGSKSSAGDLDVRQYGSSPEPLEYSTIVATPSNGSENYELMPMDRAH
jgi:hypothetical protein